MLLLDDYRIADIILLMLLTQGQGHGLRSRSRWLSWMRHPTRDQEVADSTPAEVGNILHEIFSTVILSLLLIQEGQLSVSGERMCKILVNRLED